LMEFKQQGHAQGNFRGLLHVLIGRHIEKADGTLVSNGIAWRELAGLLKKVRWEKEAVRELGLEPSQMPPRDRQRYWYVAITQAQVDSEEEIQAGDRLAEAVQSLGYRIGPAPGR